MEGYCKDYTILLNDIECIYCFVCAVDWWYIMYKMGYSRIGWMMHVVVGIGECFFTVQVRLIYA